MAAIACTSQPLVTVTTDADVQDAVAIAPGDTYYDVEGDAAFDPADVDAASDNLGQGLVGYWRFDEGAGVNVADSSGQGNHGLVYETLTVVDDRLDPNRVSKRPVWTDSVSGTALTFSGRGTWVGVPASTSIDEIHNRNTLTISAWVYFTSHENIHGHGYAAIVQRHRTGSRQDHFALLSYLGGASASFFFPSPKPKEIAVEKMALSSPLKKPQFAVST